MSAPTPQKSRNCPTRKTPSGKETADRLVAFWSFAPTSFPVLSLMLMGAGALTDLCAAQKFKPVPDPVRASIPTPPGLLI